MMRLRETRPRRFSWLVASGPAVTCRRGRASCWRSRPLCAGMLVLAGTVALVLAMAGPAAAYPPPRISPHPVPPAPAPAPGQAPAQSTNSTLFCQVPSAQYHCYLPKQMRTAYNIDPLLKAGNDGTGRTIVIIDAFQDPTLSSDVARFDSVTGLGAPSLKVVAPFGLTPFDPTNPDQVSWSGEIALDVEWAHAIAPGAKIKLVLATSDNDPDLYAAQKWVVDNRAGDVVSMSFAEAESCMDPALMAKQNKLFKTATERGITWVAGSGDYGATQLTCDFSNYMTERAAATPASDPSVTSVGGTNLVADLQTGHYKHEEVWNEPKDFGAGGGGFSTVYSAPTYQQGDVTGAPTYQQGDVTGGSTRGIPDVTYSASNKWGVYVAWGSSGQPYEDWTFSGTSAGTPQWAALFAIADQMAERDLGNVNPRLYELGEGDQNAYFNDITKGNNDFQGIEGFSAIKGWDAASGWGSPNAAKLVPALAARGSR